MSSEQNNTSDHEEEISVITSPTHSPRIFTPTIIETKHEGGKRWSVLAIKEKFETLTKSSPRNEDRTSKKSIFQYAKEKFSKEPIKEQPLLKRQQSEQWSSQLNNKFTPQTSQKTAKNQNNEIIKDIDDEDSPIINIESPREVLKSPELWKFQKLEKKEDYSYVSIDLPIWNENPFETEYLQALDESIEEFLNPFWEECIFDINPLYEEDKIIINSLYEEEIEIFNQLFKEPIKGIPYYYYDHFTRHEERIIESMKKFIKPNESDSETFTGFQICQFLQDEYQNYVVKEDLYVLAQQFMDYFIFKDVYLRNRKFTENSNYIFTEDIEIIDGNHINKIVKGSKIKYIPKSEIYRTLRNIDNSLKMLCENFKKIIPYQYMKMNKNLGYNTLWKSEEFLDLKKKVVNLQKIDPKELTGDRRTCFYINLYNIMILHGLFKCMEPENALERDSYFKENYYLIGNYQIDIYQLKNNILLGKSRSSRYKEYQYHQDLSIEFDPRVHFTLHDGTISSPILRDFCEENLHKQLKEATKFFILTEIEIDDKQSTIILPFIFQEYQVDFGDDLNETLIWISKYYPKEERESFLNKTKTYQILFKDKDIKLNQKSKEEEIHGFDIKFEEIAQNVELRQSFRKFCEQEASTENVDCWEEILEFKKIQDPQERYKFGEGIYEKYIGSKSTQPINISKKSIIKVRNEIEAERKSIEKNSNYTPNVQITLYDNIQKLLDIVMVDSFTRYKFSDIYFQYVEKHIDQLNKRKDDEYEELSKKKKKRKSQSIYIKF